MSCSLEARESALPYPYAGHASPDASDEPDHQTRLVCFSAKAVSTRTKFMSGLSKRIEKKIRWLARSLVAKSIAEGRKALVYEGMGGSRPDDASESGYATPVEEFSGTFPDPTTESVSERPVETRTSTFPEKAASDDSQHLARMSFEAGLAHLMTGNAETPVESKTGMFPEKEASLTFEAAVAQTKARNLSLLRAPNVQGPTTEQCMGSNLQIRSTGGGSLDKCSADRGTDSRKYLRRYPSICGSLDLQQHSTCTIPADTRRNSSFTVSDLPRYESTGGRLDSRRSSTAARHSSFTVSDLPRYESTVGKLDSRRSSTHATVADSRRSHSTYSATSDARRYSTGAREVPVPSGCKKSSLLSPVSCVRSLLNPATSMETFLSLVCTEETLVSTPDSRVQFGAQTSKRSSSEMFLRPGLSTKTGTENLEWSTTIRRGYEIAAPEDRDRYSNSNISWSNPLEDEPPLNFESPKKEEPRPSTSERSPPLDHLAVYVGIERKKLFISSHVFKHELFKQLLNSHHYKVEQRNGNSAVVLTCDIDYFRRLLFFVDKRPEGIR